MRDALLPPVHADTAPIPYLGDTTVSLVRTVPPGQVGDLGDSEAIGAVFFLLHVSLRKHGLYLALNAS